MVNNINETKDLWYQIKNVHEIDSPSLVIYPERINENIRLLKSFVKDLQQLRPHVKTHKIREVSQLLLDAGISRFKCSTIAEAEMLALAGAKDVLLSYQPVGPKIGRFLSLIKKYPGVKFSCLFDNFVSLCTLAQSAEKENVTLHLFLDLNVGMNRTGITPGTNALELYSAALRHQGIELRGMHVYDGHIRNSAINERAAECFKAYAPVEDMRQTLIRQGFPKPLLVAGGSPTFPIHAKSDGVECSPGTFVFWDFGYRTALPEQPFQFAALLITRVISLPDSRRVCVDLGYKSVASENPLEKRVVFLNAPDLNPIGHSEEHLVLQAPENHPYKIGDVLYGLPYHICPTTALYEKVMVIEDKHYAGEWKVISRDRKIEI